MALISYGAAHKYRAELSREPPSTFKGYRELTEAEIAERRNKLAAFEASRGRQQTSRLSRALQAADSSVQAAAEEGEAADAGMAAVDEDSSSSRSSSSGSGSNEDEPPPKRRRQPLLDEEVQLLTQLFPGRDGTVKQIFSQMGDWHIGSFLRASEAEP